MANIVKHSFIKGPKIASRARAHLNYIQHRPGEDRERAGRDGLSQDEDRREAARPLYVVGIDEDQSRPGKSGQDFRDALWNKDERGRVVHKFILSPSVSGVDMHAYTREVMDSISQKKGQDLRYAFVVHDNTDNRHSHVVVLGKDGEGHDVRFGRNDYTFMKHFGDRYLEREHGVELRFDKELEMMARVQGQNLYLDSMERSLKVLEQPPKERSFQIDEDFKHLLNINKNWSESLNGPSREGELSLGSTWLHDRGRLVEVHDLFQNTTNKDKWQDIYNNTEDQSLKDYAEERLSQLTLERQEAIAELATRAGLKPESFDGFLKEIQQQFADENREIDMVLFPEKYEPAQKPVAIKEIDYERVEAQDKIILESGKILSKYDSAAFLDETRIDLKEGREERIPGEQYSKLCSWIGKKEVYGDNCFGEPPLRELEPGRSLDLEKLSADRSDSLEGLADDAAGSSRDLAVLLKPAEPELSVLNPEHEISIQDALDARESDASSLDESLAMVREHQDDEFNPFEIERSICDFEGEHELAYHELVGEQATDSRDDAEPNPNAFADDDQSGDNADVQVSEADIEQQVTETMSEHEHGGELESNVQDNTLGNQIQEQVKEIGDDSERPSRREERE